MTVSAIKPTLASLWPRPDWASFINDERPDEVIKALINIYSEVRDRPREGDSVITELQWEESYIAAISILKALFRKTQSVEQARAINKRFAERCDINYDSISTTSLENNYMYWSISKLSLPADGQDALKLKSIEEKHVA